MCSLLTHTAIWVAPKDENRHLGGCVIVHGLRVGVVGGADNNFCAFPPSCYQLLESLRARIRQFYQICSLLTHLLDFGELVHVVNIDEAVTLWRHMTLRRTCERVVTANNERWAFVHHL